MNILATGNGEYLLGRSTCKSAGFSGIPRCTATFLALLVNSHLLVGLGANLFQRFRPRMLAKASLQPYDHHLAVDLKNGLLSTCDAASKVLGNGASWSVFT